MAIINRPDRPEPIADAAKTGIVRRPAPPQAAPAPAPAPRPPRGDGRQAPPQRKSARYLLASAMALLALGGIAAYLGAPELVASVRQPRVDAEQISLEIDKMVRISSLIDLIDRKIEQNRNALQSAQSRKDQVIADTMRLALANNLSDRQSHQSELAEVLTSLHGVYTADPDAVSAAFQSDLQATDDAYKPGRSAALARAMSLVKSVPDGVDPRRHFTETLAPEVAVQEENS